MKVELLLCLLVYQWYNQQPSHVYVKYVVFFLFPQFFYFTSLPFLLPTQYFTGFCNIVRTEKVVEHAYNSSTHMRDSLE